MGMVKPEAEIYLTVIDKLGVPASDVVFVDDRVENIAAARAAASTACSSGVCRRSARS